MIRNNKQRPRLLHLAFSDFALQETRRKYDLPPRLFSVFSACSYLADCNGGRFTRSEVASFLSQAMPRSVVYKHCQRLAQKYNLIQPVSSLFIKKKVGKAIPFELTRKGWEAARFYLRRLERLVVEAEGIRVPTFVRVW